MKIVLISDIHFGIKKSDKIFLENQLNFFKNELIPYMQNNNLTTMAILGDLFDTRNSLNSYMKSEVYKLFEYINDQKIKVYIFPGNHDIYFRNTINVHSLDFLKKFENVTVIEDIELRTIENRQILFVPWRVDYNDFKRRVANKNFHCDICLGHFDIIGFPYNNHQICEDGIETNILLNNYSLTFSGHFHKRNVYKLGNEEVIMIGSPFQQNRGDKNDERGFCVLNLEDLKYEFINSKETIKFIELHYPEEIQEELIKGNVVDVKVNYDGNKIDEKFQDYIKLIEKFNPAYPPNIFINNTLFDNVDDNNYEIKSLSELINEFIENLKIENKREIKEIIADLYTRVKGE